MTSSIEKTFFDNYNKNIVIKGCFFMQQISICTEEIIKEIDNIYGLDKCKETIINYNTYINLNEQLNLGNYNILIRNKSQYNSYEKLVEILYKLIK